AARRPKPSSSPPASPGSPGRWRPPNPISPSAGRPPRRPTGRAAPASAPPWPTSTTAMGAAASPGERWWWSSATAGTPATRPSSASRWPAWPASPTVSCGSTREPLLRPTSRRWPRCPPPSCDGARSTLQPGEQVGRGEGRSPAFVAGQQVGVEDLAPLAAGAAVEEADRTLPEMLLGVRDDDVGPPPHGAERRRLHQRRPAVLRDVDPQAAGQPAHLAGQVGLEVLVVEEHDVIP